MATIAQDALMREDPVALFWAQDILRLYSDEHTAKNEGKYAFVDAVTWADDIRRDKGSWQRDWHFIDIPIIDDQLDPSNINL